MKLAALIAKDLVFPLAGCEHASDVLERVDIHLVQMNALTRQRIDMKARGVCS
jgi:hypothetical protein